MKNSELDNLREELDNIDNQLIELITKRARIALDISDFKKVNNLPIFHPAREMVILRRIQKKIQNPMSIELMWDIWRALINANTAIQASLTIFIEKTLSIESKQLIYNYFGKQNKIIDSDSPIKNLGELNEKSDVISIVKTNNQEISTLDGKSFGIIGSLPGITNKHDNTDLFILGRANYIKTGSDLTVISLTTNNKNIIFDKENIEMILNKSKITIRDIVAVSAESILIIIEGFYDDKIETDLNLSEMLSSCQINIIGVYPEPLVKGD
tara:strand:- start:6139 stop:6945 length:807 start_codon:yes stop_codon:yes gene_type:complete